MSSAVIGRGCARALDRLTRTCSHLSTPRNTVPDQRIPPSRPMPRDRGGNINLTEGTGGILAMCPCDRFLEIYKRDMTFRIETPETIDPERTNPNAPMVATVADRLGCAHPIVARVLLQGRDILDLAILSSAVDKAAVVGKLHAIKEALVACHKAADQVAQHVAAADERWAASQATSQPAQRVIPSLPQVPDLELTVTQFLISAKRAIGVVCGLVTHSGSGPARQQLRPPWGWSCLSTGGKA
jgi:hypothetical protein